MSSGPRSGTDGLDRTIAELRELLEQARAGNGGADAFDASGALKKLARLDALTGLVRRTALHSFGEFERRVDELSLLRKAGALFRSVFELSALHRGLLDLTVDAVRCDGARLYTVDASGGPPELCGARGDSESLPAEVERGVAEAARTRQPQRLEGPGEASTCIEPLISQGTCLGVLLVFGRDEALAQSLVSMADLAALALRHAQLCEEHLRHQRDLERLVEHRTREVNEARAALSRQERVAAMGKLAASIAHEVNNPMSYLVSNLSRASEYGERFETALPLLLQVARAAIELPEDVDPRVDELRALAGQAERAVSGSELSSASREFGELIGEALEGTDRIRRVGEDLRSFANGVAGTLEAIDLNALVETAVHIAGAEAKQQVEIERRLGVLPPVRCQRYQVTQVLLNLVQNAIEAIDGSGSVRVATRVENDHAVVEVTDDGPGFDSDQLGRMFEPFFSTKDDGSGLGLSISRDIAAAHRGSLDANCGPEGTTFRLRLPL